MDAFSFISLFGGIGFFLYGMSLMGSGLEKMAGGKLERILENLTSNRFKAVLLGAGVTALIQSSAATTVMVVGFVNSGIMKLAQAIGVIMGANIGTTVTSWILSLASINGENFITKLLMPEHFSPIFAIFGAILVMFSKRKKRQNIGTILIGFAILMTGMITMTASMKPLADIPEFAQFLTLFKNPLFGVIAGAVMTAIIQSSSASVGILQALSATGSITFGAAIPIILGQNIGTTVTAMISSIGTKTNARRTAVVHLYFNIIGTVIFLVLFYAINAVVKFTFMDSSVTSTGIAIVHTLFNFTTTLVLLPFIDKLEKLAMLTIKDSEEDENEFAILDPRFLQRPSFAVERCAILTEKMAKLAKENIVTSISLINNYDEDVAQKVADIESKVDKFEDRLGNYLIKITAENMSESDSNNVTLLLHVLADFERISDHAVNISESSLEKFEKDISFSGGAENEYKVLTDAILEIVDTATTAFITRDIELAKSVEPLEEVVDDICSQMRSRHIQRLQKGDCTIETGFVFTDMLTDIERISDHCSNIAIGIIQHADDGEDYVHEIKNKGKLYKNKFAEYSEKYILPKEI